MWLVITFVAVVVIVDWFIVLRRDRRGRLEFTRRRDLHD